ncbi:MAG TPA: ABC transporter permease [Bacteroidota bacterium]|nr:ABC transporter permease [Bacteroidota bacterium]
MNKTTPLLLPALSLCRRELVRFYRQKSRIVGVIGSPLVFWFLIGSGLGTSFRQSNSASQMNYLEYFYPGTIVLTILFTAIFSTISIIEDRREGFLQSVLVAPVSNGSIALGKILGGTALSVAQCIILLALAPIIGISFSFMSFVGILFVLIVISFGLTGLGFLIAWRMESSQGFHAIMNLFLIPLWLLSGALFPATGAAGWIGVIMRMNPLSYGVTALRELLYINATLPAPELAPLLPSILVATAFAAGAYALSAYAMKR